MEWLHAAGWATLGDVLTRMHHERYYSAQLAYMQRAVPYAKASKLALPPFSAYSDESGYNGAAISDNLLKTLWERRMVWRSLAVCLFFLILVRRRSSTSHF